MSLALSLESISAMVCCLEENLNGGSLNQMKISLPSSPLIEEVFRRCLGMMICCEVSILEVDIIYRLSSLE